MADKTPEGTRTTERLRRALRSGHDHRWLELAMRKGLLSELQQAEARVEAQDAGLSAREFVIERGWISPTAVALLDEDLPIEDFSRASPVVVDTIPAGIAELASNPT